MSPMQRCFSDLVCQPLVTSYFIDSYLCFCTPGPWSTSTWCSASDGRYLRRQKDQLEKTAGSPSQRLAQQDSGGYQRSTAIYAVEIWDRGPGVMQQRNDHSDYATTMMVVVMMMMKDDFCQKWRVKLIFQGTYCRLSRTWIVECLKIIDVGCNVKQFDVEANQKCIIHIRP